MKRYIRMVMCCLTGLLITSGTLFADWTPRETIKLFISVPPGGAVDTLARVVVNEVSENTGWNFTVFNKPGAGGGIMLKALKKAKPDGHTIGFTPNEMIVMVPVLNPKIGFVPDDFVHIAAISLSQCGLVAMADRPWDTLMDAIEDAKKGEKISIAYQAPKMGMSTKAIEKVHGVDFQLVPVKGGAGGIKNVLGGHVDIAWGAGVQAKYVESGKMKVLASCERERIAMAPDAPTVQELGVKYVDLDAKFQFIGPVEMPQEATDAFIREIRKATQAEKVKDLIAKKLSLKIIFESGEKLKQAMKESEKEARELVNFVR